MHLGSFLLVDKCVYHVMFRFTNNILSTAQQVWLRKLGGAKPAVSENASGIITAGKAKRSASQPAEAGDRFRRLKEEERRKKAPKAMPTEETEALDSAPGSDEDSDDESKNQGGEVLEEAYAPNGNKQLPSISRPKRSKRSKRKRAV
ncbi:hypothetical protein Tsubulata_007902 [Turnera subulata]|uniref:Uncharacterized protein n=1 Tax=Turnera subulata TaxID=218843 RepID=A0A9Q0J9I7_9ROSI|nr:hypothetical protein Tsubulata_007902 [Turnera subulata]